MENIHFDYATCESQGISSLSVINMLTSLKNQSIPMHSFLLMRHGFLTAEIYYAPYIKNTPHCCFSITKSFVSLAIGFLATDGVISLDDKICQYFPEYIPSDGPHPFLQELTIRQMLSMQTPFDDTTYDVIKTENWVKSYFTTTPNHRPGMNFYYDTSSAHVLCALVEKLTSSTLMDYLRRKFLNKLDAGQEAWIMTDPQGVSQGGSGLMMTPASVMKVLWLISRNGIDEQGNQLLPADYLSEAIKKHSDTYSYGRIPEERQGYGWFFWRFSHDAYGMYGLGGQLAICWPDKDLLMVTTADTQSNKASQQLIFDAFYRYVWLTLSDSPLPENKAAEDALTAFSNTRTLIPITGNIDEEYASRLSGRHWKADDNRCGIGGFALDFNNEGGIFSYDNLKGSHTIHFSYNSNLIELFPDYHQKCAVSACWHTPHVLIILAQLIDTCIGSITFTFSFDRKGDVTVQIRRIEKTMFLEYEGCFSARLI